ncbi:MAG: hypothetical protein ABSB40_02610 [Nitrososphaeria archaeon]
MQWQVHQGAVGCNQRCSKVQSGAANRQKNATAGHHFSLPLTGAFVPNYAHANGGLQHK